MKALLYSQSFNPKITLYRVGTPIPTEAVVLKPQGPMEAHSSQEFKTTGLTLINIPGEQLATQTDNSEGEKNQDWTLRAVLEPKDILWGLGEQMGGMNRKGRRYTMYCSDVFEHTPDKRSLYGSHPFLIVRREKGFQAFFLDHPGISHWDLGFTDPETLEIRLPGSGFDLYGIIGSTPAQLVQAYMDLTGRPILPPRWAFGYHQSRWGYASAKDLEEVANRFQEADIPLDMIAMDIDYMDHFKVFTIREDNFPQPAATIAKLKDRGIRVVPIIDPGVKVEPDYSVYESGLTGDHFVKDLNGKPYKAQVWPGWVHFPDFQKASSRNWWGQQYRSLIDMGIEGFWNDMNEPAIFFAPSGIQKMETQLKVFKNNQDQGVENFFALMQVGGQLQNNPAYHYEMVQDHPKLGPISLAEIHNLYGSSMTQATREGLNQLAPEKRTLLFSRASYAGAQRYGGIWTGDNKSWWEHILLNLQMVVSLNLCGFLYTGADMGGFGDDATGEILVRWTQLALWMPLMRNHSALGTRNQEPYQFNEKTLIHSRELIHFRYRLIPYLYSLFLQHRENGLPLFKPLGFEYNDDQSLGCEDQVLMGEGVMLAPIYQQNARGRTVWLPGHSWLRVHFRSREDLELTVLPPRNHYLEAPGGEFDFFLKPDQLLVLGPGGLTSQKAKPESIEVIGLLEEKAEYEFWEDQGLSTDSDSCAPSKLTITAEVIGELMQTHKILLGNQKWSSVQEIKFRLIRSDGTLWKEKGFL